MYINEEFKEYTLMHKNIKVADITIDEVQGGIINISDIYSLEHFPIGSLENNAPNRKNLNKWWTGRSIPASRDGLKEALEKIGVTSPKELITKCLALSLSDQYWIRPKDSNINWHDVNFFENTFSDDIGELLVGNDVDGNIDMFSPNNSTDGWLKKKWKIINGDRCLLKAGSEPFYQEPFNELLASTIMEKLGIDHVKYGVVWNNDYPYSCCKCFISSETELVTADRFRSIEHQPNHLNTYQHFLSLCEKQGILNGEDFLNKMIVVDYIIANEDRHFNNFGLIRNANTLDWIGFAPIFDSGTSLKYHSKSGEIPCKPFKQTHNEQLKLVTSFEWLDFSKLNNIRNEAFEMYSYLYDADFITLSRVSEISSLLEQRINNLERYVSNKTLFISDKNGKGYN